MLILITKWLGAPNFFPKNFPIYHVIVANFSHIKICPACIAHKLKVVMCYSHYLEKIWYKNLWKVALLLQIILESINYSLYFLVLDYNSGILKIT